MKTMPLEEALKKCAPAPLVPVMKPCPMIRSTEHWTVVSTPDCQANDNVNIALLAHFYNLGPELVGMLEELRDSIESNQGPLVRNDLADRATALLSKASTVQMP